MSADATVTCADRIAAALARHGITTVFGQSNPSALMLAAERIGIRQLLYRTENAAGAMADAWARVSNRIGVVAAQNGPAATLMVAPMAEALKASVPMLVIVQEVPAAVRDRNAFQEMDHFALFAGVSKWTRRIDDPDRAVDYVDMAMVAANGGRAGPVVLLVPKDVLVREAAPPRFPREQDLGAFPLDRPRPGAGAVEHAAELVAAARAPIVLAGGGVHLSGACAALVDFAEAAAVPVATTSMGKGAIDETHPLSLGVYANMTGEYGRGRYQLEHVRSADVIVLVGTRTNENGTDGWQLLPEDATYVHVDVDAAEVGRSYEALRLVGDARAALQDLAEACGRVDLARRRQAREPLVASIAAGRVKADEVIAPLLRSDASPIAPQRVVAELEALLRPDDVVAADASLSSVWVVAYLTCRTTGQRVLTPRGIAGLGWGLPFAMGAKLARPGARAVAVVGDGGFAHVWSEIETSVRERLPVIVIVLNNGELGYQRLAELMQFGEVTTGIEFAPVDHAAVARGAGANGVTVREAAGLGPALEAALAADVTTVIDVLTDPSAIHPHGFAGQIDEMRGGK